MHTPSYLTLDKDVRQVGAAELDGFRAQISGGVIAVDHPDYEEARKLWNGMVDRRPALIARCRSEADVQAAVGFAARHRMLVSVRGGGHHIAGNAMAEGGLVIDLSGMRGVRVDAQRRTAQVEPGALLGDLDREAQAHGLAVPLGINSTTGVAGLTLGGGFGWLTRRHGMSVDNLLGARVVMADGQVREASATSEPELFWALRGGGGNFGVVTRFTFRAHPLPAGIVSGTIDVEPAQLASAFRGWRDALRTAPEELTTSYLGLPSFGEGIPPMSQIVFVWAGDDLDAATAAIAPLLALPGVTGHTIERMAYADVLMDEQPDADQVDAPAMTMVDENGFAARFDDALIDELAAVKQELGDSVLMVRLLGGAYARVPADATAWGYRDTEAWLISAAFLPEALAAEHEPRLRATWARLAPWLNGMYGNFSSLADPVTVMYPPRTLERLRAIKAVYDPANLFHRTHNITPA